MRAYEFAQKTGIDYGSVVQLAEASDIEIYSPLTQFEDEEVDALHAALLRADRSVFASAASQLAERRRARQKKAAQARAAHDRAQRDELEAGRRRALEAAGLVDAARPQPPHETVVEKPTAVKDLKDLLGGSESGPDEERPADAPRVSIELSKDDADYDDVDSGRPSGPHVADDDDDDDDALAYLHGKDRRAKPTGKAAKAQQPKQQLAPKPAQKEPPKPEPVKPAPAAKPAPGKPAVRPGQSMRVGGKRAGFSSVSMRTTAASAALVKPTISLSVSTREISIRGAVVVKELALKLGVRPNRLIADLMQLKVLASINQRVEPDVAIKVAQKYGYRVNVEHARDAANKKPVLKAIDADDEIPQDKPEDMKPRPPVVTFLGHVDHGKTTLMDYIRHTKVAAGEAGGITQQISAYQVDVNGRLITFLDTPGHAAFNAMRQRGAQLTDIAVIIIAADDGIMPQTQEAIKFARQAGVQIMVAITKCDKPTANVQRVKQMLQKEGLTPEEWGGDVVCCEVSGVTGQGVDNLLEMILLQADVLELTANPRRRANGYVIEAELEQGFGPSATLLVSGGTLKVGDAVLIGEHFGKVRSLIDDHGRRIKEAPPATPVKCTGLSGVPEAGAEFRVMLDEKRARTLAEESARMRKEQELSTTKAVSLDDLLSQMGEDGKRELSVVVKSDTQGSLEAIVESLRQIKSEKVSLKIIGTGTGNVSLTDVKSAAAGKAVIVGFDIGCDSGVQGQARHDGVRISSFRIIYELIDFVKRCMLDLLPPEYTEKVLGHATIKAVYDIGKVGKIAGSQMLDGKLVSSARYRILRDGGKIWEGRLQSLKHFKDEVKEVTGQQECGVNFAGFEDFAAGDTIECFMLEELPRSL
ncbi:MAG: translation initiation factor IF-2 [Kiritimatiellae bacterium]|nr:translation initiation factor IF-2 [Kiritimatiellia bacterium]